MRGYVMKFIMIVSLLSSMLLARENLSALQFTGVETTYKDKEMYIKRLKHPKCYKVGITPENIFGGDIAAKSVPEECKKSFVTSLGVIQPIKIDDEIQTVGEIEVLIFLEILDFEPEKYALVDARKPNWYEKGTIPHSVNIPFSDIREDEDFPKDYTKVLKLLNVKKDKKGKLDFSEVKKVIVYCNGNWCVQSVWAIKALVKLGYPKKKIFWYRGGMEDWVGSGFTIVKP